MAISWEQAFISAIGSKLNAFTESASILGLFVVGAMIPSVVTMTTGLNFNYGDVSMNIQTDILDAILPCMLPLALTVVIYRLLKKRCKTDIYNFRIISYWSHWRRHWAIGITDRDLSHIEI